MGTFMCGFAQRVITPEGEGIFMDGYGNRVSPAQGIHDDLYVKTGVFCIDRSDLFVIASMDVCGFNKEIYDLLTDYIEAIVGIDKVHIAVCATHTHAAPAGGILDGLPIDYDFWCSTAEILGRTVAEAMDNMCECSCSAAIEKDGILLSFNRRKRPFIDRRIRTLVFTGRDGKIRGVIASAACHPVINTSMEISADYPQVLTRRSRKEYGVPFLFLQGRGADINPVVPEGMSIYDSIEEVGGELAASVIDTVKNGCRNNVQIEAVQSIYKSVCIPMKPFETRERAQKKFQEKLRSYMETPWSLEKHYRLRELEWQRKMYRKIINEEKAEISVPIQILEMGKQLIFVFLPFEVLTNTGNKIEDYLRKMGYQEENIFVIGCTNSVNGYLTPYEEFIVGGYEVSGASHWYGLPECGEATESTVIETVKKMADSL